jgi:hypothetical protein
MMLQTKVRLLYCIAAAAALSGLQISSSSSVAQPVTATPVGNAIWKPVDFHVFTAPASSDEEFFGTNNSLLPSPKHQPHDDLIVGPGVPHAGPYDTELAQGVAANGYREGPVFSAADFSGAPNGVYFVWMNVPNPGTTGSSPDFASGPIIPNAIFPLSTVVEIHRNGEVVDGGAFDASPLDGSLNPPFAVDGYSHAPFFLEEDLTFLPGLAATGQYAFQVRMIDQQGNGWQIVAPFQVVPEPASVGLLVIAFVCIGHCTRIRTFGNNRRTMRWW